MQLHNPISFTFTKYRYLIILIRIHKNLRAFVTSCIDYCNLSDLLHLSGIQMQSNKLTDMFYSLFKPPNVCEQAGRLSLSQTMGDRLMIEAVK